MRDESAAGADREVQVHASRGRLASHRPPLVPGVAVFSFCSAVQKKGVILSRGKGSAQAPLTCTGLSTEDGPAALLLQTVVA